MYDVIIIGGGLGGLTAGARLSMSGKKVLLLEQHFIVGGCATAFKRKEYIMDVGLHEIDGFNDSDKIKNNLFKELDIGNKINMIKIPELFEIVLPNGKKLRLPHGKENIEQFLLEKYPKEKKGITNFIKTIESVQHEFYKLPNEGVIRNFMLPIFPLKFPNIFKTSKLTVGEWMDKNIFDEELKLVLTANLGYYSDNPYKLNMTYFSVACAGYFLGGAWYIKGGGQKLSNTLANIIENNGGQILTNKTVKRIIVDDSKIKGIEFIDTCNEHYGITKCYSQCVISNISIESTGKLLPTMWGNKIVIPYKNFTPAASLITIYLGINAPNLKKYGVKSYSTFIQGKNISSLKDIINSYGSYFDNENKGFVLVDYGQIDSGLTPKDKCFACICTTDKLGNWEGMSRNLYIKEKERIAQILIKRLENHFPNISEVIDYIEVGTAKTIQNYIKTPNGTPYGFDQSVAQSNFKRPKFKSKISGLYFCGSWTFPGGGFTGAILSGELCAQRILQTMEWDLKKKDKKLLADPRKVKLISKKEIAKDTVLLTFEKPKDFIFTSGQYVELQIENEKYHDKDLMHRALSIVSHPNENTLSFAMRLSSSIYKTKIKEMKKNDIVTIFGPMGNFEIKNFDSNIMFIISGIGITPVISMLKELVEKNFQNKVVLIYTNKSEKQVAFD
ncbi:hypothetical protein IGI95_002674 [Enterococcus sp. DIV0784]|uniref:FAD-dependent oxidoreductase n=1 Tax=unclassified Enterococcus TaxID=2608891 RepID=UPI003F203926